MGFVWVEKVKEKQWKPLLSTLCSYSGWGKEGERREWSLETWPLGETFCSSPGSTSDHAGETVVAGTAGEFQWQPRENLAAIVSFVILCQSRIVASVQVKSQ